MERQSKPKPFAKRSFGQNFLVDPNYIEKIIQSLDVSPTDTIVEIGPGRGALTERLVSLSNRVIAIELDQDMVEVLKKTFTNDSSLTIVQADVLRIDFTELLAGKRAKLVANLPYYISTAVLQHLTEHRSAFKEMVLMFQREVAHRITASPGSTDRGFLTVIVEAYLDVEHLFDVPPSAFRPAPKVWSSVVRLRPKHSVAIDSGFTQLVSSGFLQKRKTILNNLKNRYDNAAVALLAAGIDPTRRAETLSVEEWVKLTLEIASAEHRDPV